MKSVTRVFLLAVLFLLAGVTSSQIASAASVLDSGQGAASIHLNQSPRALPNAQGCSGTPTIQYAFANPAVTFPGQVTTLSWGLVGNASAAFLQFPDGRREGIGTPGTRQVNPTQTTTYFVIGVCGPNEIQFPITVTVQNTSTCNGTPQISSFNANPTSINNGQSSTLSWGLVGNADAVQLSSSAQGGSGVPSPGSVVVNPTQTTTYFLTAWCRGVSAQAQVVVTVNNPAPPPPPASDNRITSIQFNGGLSNATALVITANYFWNGQDAPAVLQGTAFNAGGQQVSQSNATRINPNVDFHANLNFRIDPQQVQRVNVCMIGSSGTELVCQSASR